jgi:hypothetical protein
LLNSTSKKVDISVADSKDPEGATYRKFAEKLAKLAAYAAESSLALIGGSAELYECSRFCDRATFEYHTAQIESKFRSYGVTTMRGVEDMSISFLSGKMHSDKYHLTGEGLKDLSTTLWLRLKTSDLNRVRRELLYQGFEETLREEGSVQAERILEDEARYRLGSDARAREVSDAIIEASPKWLELIREWSTCLRSNVSAERIQELMSLHTICDNVEKGLRRRGELKFQLQKNKVEPSALEIAVSKSTKRCEKNQTGEVMSSMIFRIQHSVMTGWLQLSRKGKKRH